MEERSTVEVGHVIKGRKNRLYNGAKNSRKFLFYFVY